MDAFETSCSRFHAYPTNLCCPDASVPALDDVRHTMVHEAERLFCDDESASVDILEMYTPEQADSADGEATLPEPPNFEPPRQDPSNSHIQPDF
ncbi:hypothetical protein LTR27_007568 [Elasticomyces elasticus]|nr:hypothetical protein LTR27_007568 [Elasticomyces elasticus]